MSFLLLFNSDDDVLQWLASQVDASKDFKICITRDNLVQRGLIQWQRQKKGSPVNKLNVTFIGEAGIDTGALSKEFLTGNISFMTISHTKHYWNQVHRYNIYLFTELCFLSSFIVFRNDAWHWEAIVWGQWQEGKESCLLYVSPRKWFLQVCIVS